MTPAFAMTFGGAPADDTMKADVLSLDVVESSADAATCRIELAATMLDDGAWRYLGDARLAPFAPLEVELGFLGGGAMANVFTGYVTGVELALGEDPDDAAVVVEAMDTSLLMSLDEKTALWSELSDDKVAAAILRRYADIVSTQATDSRHALAGSPLAQRDTDLRFVRKLAERNGFEFSFETHALTGRVAAYFRAPALAGTPQPDLCVQLGDATNVRQFRVELRAPRPTEVSIAQIDVTSGKTRRSNARSMTWRRLGRTAPAPRGGARMLALGTPTADEVEQRAAAQALRNRTAWCITADGEVQGATYGAVLRPRRTVLVRGAGAMFSGTYYVTQVTHRVVDGEEYTQRFELVRNASGLLGTERFGSRP